MGTPQFAVPSLQVLINSKHDIISVVCQPDKPKGRSKKLVKPPTKEVAEKYSIPVLQPEKIKTDEFFKILLNLSPDLIVVVAYGKIIPKNILDIPSYGCINVHASLLPKYRGAAPINWAIVNGESETGVTTMLMDEGMDTGDILLKEVVTINKDDNSLTLYNKLSKIGADLLVRTIELLENKNIKPIKQDSSKATYAPLIKKVDGFINWEKSAIEIENLIRGFQPWPTAHTTLNGKILKIYNANKIEGNAKPGEVVYIDKKSLHVGTGEGILNIIDLQLEGSKRMLIKDFLSGKKINKGEILGN